MDTSSEERDRGPAFWWGTGFGLGLLKPAPGTWGSLLGLPMGWVIATQSWPVGAVLWTLLFDIWKPWPVSVLDRTGGTAGVMLDDLAAAGYTLAFVLLLMWP